MILYLERLAAALLARDPEEIRRRLDDGDARSLPSVVRREALAIARDGATGRRTPVQTLRHLYRTRQLHEGLPRAAGTVAPPPSVSAERAASIARPARPRPSSIGPTRPRAASPIDAPGVAASPDR